MPFKPLIAPEKQVSRLGRKSMLIIGLPAAGLCALSMLSSTWKLQSHINFEEVRGNIKVLRATGRNETTQNYDLRGSVDIRAAERYMYNQRRALINESTAIKMNFTQSGQIGALFFHYNFGDEVEYIGYTHEGAIGTNFLNIIWKKKNSLKRNEST